MPQLHERESPGCHVGGPRELSGGAEQGADKAPKHAQLLDDFTSTRSMQATEHSVTASATLDGPDVRRKQSQISGAPRHLGSVVELSGGTPLYSVLSIPSCAAN